MVLSSWFLRRGDAVFPDRGVMTGGSDSTNQIIYIPTTLEERIFRLQFAQIILAGFWMPSGARPIACRTLSRRTENR